jgi:hypothetical protein
MVLALPEVRSVIAPWQPAQKQMPVRSVGPLTIRGAVIEGWRVFRSRWTASNSSSGVIGGTDISAQSARSFSFLVL